MSALVNTGLPYFKPSNLVQSTVLQTILASHADLGLTNGTLTCTGGISIQLSQVTGYVITPFTQGQNQQTSLNLSGITVADNTAYKIIVTTMADNFQYPIEIISGVGSTATSIAAQFATAINNNINFPVTAISTGTYLVLSEVSNTTQGFLLNYPSGAVEANTVQLSGGTISGTFVVGETATQATSGATMIIVSQDATAETLNVIPVSGTIDTTHAITGGTSSATYTPSAKTTLSNVQSSGTQVQVSTQSSQNITTGQYRLYAITYTNPQPNSGTGGRTGSSALAYIWANESATNFSTFDTQLKAILGGTATPTSSYLGAGQ